MYDMKKYQNVSIVPVKGQLKGQHGLLSRKLSLRFPLCSRSRKRSIESI
jgi:hypothetical protein